MSAVIYRNCPVCGQAYEVHEQVHNFSIVMFDQAVTECLVCGEELKYQREEDGDV